MKKKKERLMAVDNMKAFLIGCVVLGHLCEVIKFPYSSYLYLLIYSFHMPAFVFLSGFCSSREVHYDKIARNYVYPYVVFQILYVLFDRIVLKNDSDMQFVKPYWLLWYLLALVIWNLLIPFVVTDSRKKRAVIMTAAVAMALLAGFDENIGYYMSLSRIIVFFPFFLAGLYSQEYGRFVFPQCFGESASHKQLLRITATTAAVGIAILLFEYRKGIKASWLYQAAAYEKWHYNVVIRLGAIICAVLFIHFLCVCMPNRTIPFVTKLGQNTMPVFLLHGFVIRLLKYYPVPAMKQYPVLCSVLLIVVLLAVLSSKAVKKLCRPILYYPF